MNSAIIDVLDASGQADLETLVNLHTVECECSGRIREAVPEAVEEGAKEPLARGDCMGRLKNPGSDPRQVGEYLGSLLEETSQERLCRGMTNGLSPDGLEGFQKSGPL